MVKDVLEYMKFDYFGLSFDIIYCNLLLFVELGVFEMMEFLSEKYFWFKCVIVYYYYYFICLDCGKIKEIEVCLMEYVDEDLWGYNIIGYKFEIYG